MATIYMQSELNVGSVEIAIVFLLSLVGERTFSAEPSMAYEERIYYQINSALLAYVGNKPWWFFIDCQDVDVGCQAQSHQYSTATWVHRDFSNPGDACSDRTKAMEDIFVPHLHLCRKVERIASISMENFSTYS